eukprot:1704561-Amphidinium_carterae.1
MSVTSSHLRAFALYLLERGGLLSMDFHNGLSDPYCELFLNGKDAPRFRAGSLHEVYKKPALQ